MKNKYREHIKCKNSRKLEGSVNIEACVEKGRWDYAVGYSGKTTEKEIDVVMKKARWLRKWKSRTPFKKDDNLYWISPGKTGFSRNAVKFSKIQNADDGRYYIRGLQNRAVLSFAR